MDALQPSHRGQAEGPFLEDPESVRIYDALDYDFPRSFGDPDGAHPMRALKSDRLLRAWMSTHPGRTVVSLGEGLEMQALRVDDGKVQWRSVDLPEDIDELEPSFAALHLTSPTSRSSRTVCRAGRLKVLMSVVGMIPRSRTWGDHGARALQAVTPSARTRSSSGGAPGSSLPA